MALVPVFIVFFYLGQGGSQLCCLLAFAVFVIASATDAVDGHIARRQNLVTNFGKLMDPLADKVLTTSAFIVFVDVHIMPAWMVVVILTREFAITGLRGVAASEGVVIAAEMSGQLQTVFQMVAVCVILLGSAIGDTQETHSLWVFVSGAGIVLIWCAVIITVYSGIEYLWKGRKLLNLK
jgi:CDP-diacylglycerol--glycerol-3-phosphate 3-phosphatidyltransferase